MTSKTNSPHLLGAALLVLITAIMLFVLFVPKVAAQTATAAVPGIQCPAGAKSCKVVVLTAEQEGILDQLITQTCIAGPYAQIGEVVKFYKEMLAKAPAGVPAASSEPKKP